MTVLNNPLSSQYALALRLFVGASFGLAIAFLVDDPSYRTTDPGVLRQTLAMTLAMIASVIWAGAGTMRRVSLAIWTGIAFVLVGYIMWVANQANIASNRDLEVMTILVFPLLFIAHELVSSGDQAGKWIAPYEIYFDEAWKRGVQLALAIAFTLLFWGILWLGAALLGFIRFNWLKELLDERYFALPITGLAFGAAVHLGDIQTKLLANVRSLILGVLSWLLPVIALIGAIFVGSLMASGLAPLWATKAATATMMAACIGFVLLINAAYQQGDTERPVSVVLKWCVRAAAILLLIFAVLAAWSLGLRIDQYGLSGERVFAGLGVLIALAYGIAYTVAVFVPGRWMAAIEPINIGLGVVMCAMFIAILTPIATPDRLSVNDQVSRLISGKVSVANFDWWLLKDDTGSYGTNGLKELAASPNLEIANKAKAALANTIGDRPRTNSEGVPVERPATRADIAAIPVVFPVGAKLPDSFVTTNFGLESYGFTPPGCLRFKPTDDENNDCKIALLDLNDDRVNEVLIHDDGSLSIMTLKDGRWIGNTDYINIGPSMADFDAGKLTVVPPLWNDVLVGQQRARISEFQQSEVPEVPQEASAPSPTTNEPAASSK